MKSFYQKDIAASDLVATERDVLADKCDVFVREINKLEAGEFANKIKALLSHIVDISRFSRYTI